MISRINVQHFRGIRQTRLEGLAQINLLTGPPGAGKSDMLEAVRMGCCGGRIERMLCEGPRPQRTHEQWAARQVLPRAWKSLVHHEVDGNGNATPSGPTRIELQAASASIETRLDIERETRHDRQNHVFRARTTPGRTEPARLTIEDDGCGPRPRAAVRPAAHE